MEGGAIVPDHQVTGFPGMAVDELPLGGVFQQIQQQHAPFGNRHTHYPTRMRADEQ